MTLKDILEPGIIVIAFTIGTLLNRRRGYRNEIDDLEANSPQIAEHRNQFAYVKYLKSWPQRLIAEITSDHKLGGTLASKFLAKFPFLLEILYWNLVYWPYQLLRALSAKALHGDDIVFSLAEAHAIEILRVEQILGIAIERSFQQYILDYAPWLISILANIYYSHIVVGVCFVVYTYTYLPLPNFQKIRRTIAVDNFIAFTILSIWRCMPPRLLPEEYGFVDVLHKSAKQGTVWTNNSMQLTIAAMPSLHFGTSLLLAFSLCRYSPHRWLRVVAPLWPAAMLITIIATAHHFVLDAIVGAMVPILGWRINEVLLILEPWEIRILSLLTIEKPSRLPKEITMNSKGEPSRYG